MAQRFCEHLQDYGSLYADAEAAYLQCNELVDQALTDESGNSPGKSLADAVSDWLAADGDLRNALVDLAASGRVKVPKKKPRAIKRHGTIRCSRCGFKVLKLKYSAWEVAANGLVQYQGNELPVSEHTPVG
jgi:hypothetical protein